MQDYQILKIYYCFTFLYAFGQFFDHDNTILMSIINIPLNKTINNCVSDLHNKNLHNGKISKRDLFKLLETATSECFLFLIT